jgi:hypothetical protein
VRPVKGRIDFHRRQHAGIAFQVAAFAGKLRRNRARQAPARTADQDGGRRRKRRLQVLRKQVAHIDETACNENIMLPRCTRHVF